MNLFLYFYQFLYAIYYLAGKPYKNKKGIVNIEIYFQVYFGKIIIYHKIKTLEVCLLISHIFLAICACCCVCIPYFNDNFDKMMNKSFYIGIGFQSIIFGVEFWLLWEAYFFYENQKSNSIILNLFLMLFHFILYIISFISLLILSHFLRN